MVAAAKEGDAFRPKLFGKKIIVERVIRRDGSAEYRMKNDQGMLVTKLKQDLDAMLDHLNIQVRERMLPWACCRVESFMTLIE